MTIEHRVAADLLEAYALGALDLESATAVAAHIAACVDCRAEAGSLLEVADALATSFPERDPSPGLRGRVLAAAAGEKRSRQALPRLRPAQALQAALLLFALGTGALVVRTGVELREATGEREEYLAIARAVSEGGRWWSMSGEDRFAGAGGSLIVSRRDSQAFVLFHDLPPLSRDQRYAVWLIRADGGWVRAANFDAAPQPVQRVDLALQVADFIQCAVTAERSETGRRQGPLVMQSRIFTP